MTARALAAELPARRATDIFGDKWTIAIMHRLATGRVGHFNQLLRDLTGLSRNILARTLRGLERDGLIAKHKLDGPLPASRYELTEHGRRIGALIGVLGDWAAENADLVEAIMTRRGTAHSSTPTPPSRGWPGIGMSA